MKELVKIPNKNFRELSVYVEKQDLNETCSEEFLTFKEWSEISAQYVKIPKVKSVLSHDLD